ncbi:MAG: DNA polymerase I [Acidobacteriota bacterium]
MARLYLVDGMSHIYRAYYAIRGLTNRHGMSTNAVYGFVTMMRKLIQDEEPDYLGVAFDTSGPTVRHEEYEAYKATRPKMPEDLAEQLPYIRRYCEAMRIPIIELEGYEADDVIGTLATQAASRGLEVIIVSIDKDLLQLVRDNISVLDTRNGTLYTPREVEEKWGVPPERIVDVLSLIGDTSDNIPGAPGIGEKGAKTLLQQYKTLEALLDHADEVPRKTYRESLLSHRDQILQSRELLRIHCDLPIELELEKLRLSEPDTRALRELYEELGFASLLSDLPPEPAAVEELTVRRLAAGAELPSVDPVAVTRVAVAAAYRGGNQLEALVDGLALAWREGEAIYADREWLDSAGDVSALLGALPEPTFHDLKPWLLAARAAGWTPGVEGAADVMLMAYLLSPNDRDFSLPTLERTYLDRSAPVPEALSTPADTLGRRAQQILRLRDRLLPELETMGLLRLFREVEMPLVEVLAAMEWVGVRVDVDQLAELSKELEVEIEKIQREIFQIAGEEFNLNSPRQLAHILFEKLHLPSGKKTGKAGHLSTGVEVLEELAVHYEIAQKILDYRELAKLKSTYVDALPPLVNPRTGRVHTSYNQMVASTGRLSSSNPNLQNIPIRSEMGRRIRRAFVAEPGFLILSADYSQIELRVMAHLSEDPVLVAAFRRGEDIHARTAREVFGDDSGLDPQELRRRAKVINFGIIYGLSAYGLARSLKIDRSDAQRFIDSYFERYAGVKRWIEQTLADAERYGYVKTMFGRIRQIPEINSKNWNLREFAKRTAINAPIQGTAADLIKMAMVAIHRRLEQERRRTRLILQVHDELVFEVAEDEVDQIEAMVRKEMEGVAHLIVPLKVDIGVGRSWYETK